MLEQVATWAYKSFSGGKDPDALQDALLRVLQMAQKRPLEEAHAMAVVRTRVLQGWDKTYEAFAPLLESEAPAAETPLMILDDVEHRYSGLSPRRRLALCLLGVLTQREVAELLSVDRNFVRRCLVPEHGRRSGRELYIGKYARGWTEEVEAPSLEAALLQLPPVELVVGSDFTYWEHTCRPKSFDPSGFATPSKPNNFVGYGSAETPSLSLPQLLSGLGSSLTS